MALFHRSTTPQTRVSGLCSTPVHRCSSQMTSTHRAVARVFIRRWLSVVYGGVCWKLQPAERLNELLVTNRLLHADFEANLKFFIESIHLQTDPTGD